MKPKIRIDFSDFGANVSKQNHFLYRVLSERFDLDLCDRPDFLVYDVAGHAFRLHSCVRIRFTCESSAPDFNETDYSVGPLTLEDPRHLYLPVYVVFGPAEAIVKQHEDAKAILARKTKFCSFIVSGYNPRKNRNRLDIFNAISRYKRVDSGGRFMNNIGGPIPNRYAGKQAFLAAYKFNIAYENAIRPGYITEKIYHAMQARCLPIYWGDSSVKRQFNPRSFLDRSDFPSDEALVQKVIELDQDDGKYLEYARQPYLPNDEPTACFSHERILDFFERIFDTPIQPVARRRKWFRLGRWMLVKRHHLQPLPEAWQGKTDGAPGVRPSPGAAISISGPRSEHPNPPVPSTLAAPGDGRTPGAVPGSARGKGPVD
jgi:alpha(1,3/1,4) fucosyltransferase